MAGAREVTAPFLVLFLLTYWESSRKEPKWLSPTTYLGDPMELQVPGYDLAQPWLMWPCITLPGSLSSSLSLSIILSNMSFKM